MSSTFSSWASREDARPHTWNGERDAERRPEEEADSSLSPPSDAPLDEMREALAAARRRLQYFEGFAPWIEEQMATVVERAAEVAGESEREQERIAEEVERQRAEMERLAEECERLRTEASTIVAQANASAEGVIGEANARAGRLLAEAHQNAESMVNRLRDEAAAIVSRAVGDLTALEATSSAADAAASPVAGHAASAVPSDQPESSEAGTEWATPGGGASQPDGWESEPDAEPGVSAASATEAEEPVGDDVWTGPAVAESESAAQTDLEPEADDPSGPPSSTPVASEPAAQDDAVSETAEVGAFQWLRSALSGRDPTPGNGVAETTTESPFAGREPIPLLSGDASAQVSEFGSDDMFITRLTIHPAFTSHERGMVQRAIDGLIGVERVALGAVTQDFFELLVTHQLFTSVLGSLLTAAGEHIRLIAQHDDSLEVEVIGLDWVRTSEAAEASRVSDA